LVARAVDDVDSLQDVVLRVLQPFAVAALVGAATVAVLWAILPEAGVVMLVALLLAATAVPWLTGRLAALAESRQAAARGDLTAAVVDLLEGAPELTVLGAAAQQLDSVMEADAVLRTVARRSAGTAGIGLAMTTALAGLASWGALTLGAGAVHAGSLDGALLAVLALVPLAAFELVSPLPAATQALQRSRVAAGRVFAAMDQAPLVVDPTTPASLPSGSHRLAACGVSAWYPGTARAAGRLALSDVDLHLEPGRRVALVGPSGAGKSTLADVLVRFLPAGAGTVLLDGVPTDQLAADDVRRVVGLVEQRAHLFDTTLAENLRVGRRSATDAELEGVLGRVGLGGWLNGLPDGLSTRVGAAGSRLSGGQRQRVALARALLADFPLLVLDEPAEHLDPPAADALTEDLLALTEGRSTLLITHRLRGLEQVDEIIFLADGRVVERGTHDALLELGGRYAGTWWEERLNDPPDDHDSAPRVASASGFTAAPNEGSETP
jgi:thiol reductant ABC exporter CydC subunit